MKPYGGRRSCSDSYCTVPLRRRRNIAGSLSHFWAGAPKVTYNWRFSINSHSGPSGHSFHYDGIFLFLGIVIMEDEYKVVCALSNGATFDDLEWPRTPVSSSKYSFKANISQTMHPIHYIFCSRLVFLGSPDRNGTIFSSIISKMAADGHLLMTTLSRVSLASAGLCCSICHST